MRDRSLAGDTNTVCGFGALALLLVATLGLSSSLGVAGAQAAAASTSVQLKTTIDGRSVAGSSAAHPVRLRPNRPAQVDIDVTNEGSNDVTLSSVSLTGVVAGLTFFSYQTSVNLTLGASQSTHLRYSLDLTGLDGQATGLIPARIAVADSHRHQLASQSFVSDVRGSLDSVYGLFGLALLAITVARDRGRGLGHRHPPHAPQPLAPGPAGDDGGSRPRLGAGVHALRVPRVGTEQRALADHRVGPAVPSSSPSATSPPPRPSDQDEEEIDEAEFAAPGSDGTDTTEPADTALPGAGDGTS